MEVKVINDAGNYGKEGFNAPNRDWHDDGPSYKMRKCQSCGKEFNPTGDERTCPTCKSKK